MDKSTHFLVQPAPDRSAFDVAVCRHIVSIVPVNGFGAILRHASHAQERFSRRRCVDFADHAGPPSREKEYYPI